MSIVPIFGLELLSDAAYWTDEPTMQEIAARSVEVLLRHLSSRRFHLIGHSFGGRLAYELGQQLDAAGRAPSSIVIVDTPTTGARRSIRWRDLRSMVANAPGWMKNELEIYGAAALTDRIRNRWRFRVRATNAVSTGSSTSRGLRKDGDVGCPIATAPLPRTERGRPAIAWCTCAAASDRSSTFIGRMAAGANLCRRRA